MLDGKVERIYNVSDARRGICYAIANEVGGDAEHIYRYIQEDVNIYKHPMFVYVTVYGRLAGFIKGCEAEVPEECFKTFPRDSLSAKIDYLYVDEELHGMGIGQALMHAYTDYAMSNGFRTIHLNSSNLERTKLFYRKQGFRKINRGRFRESIYGKILTDNKAGLKR
ncbi:MAG: GNAT family N-acetyltransferase [Rickettsiales bacterium]|jgi:ribosomal protein S18 acetylase RimI-like enzyme|nr:GNAT family N-acetyltransferase [Rickettsiales bacterium]